VRQGDRADSRTGLGVTGASTSVAACSTSGRHPVASLFGKVLY
jgi:hypothetical protein